MEKQKKEKVVEKKDYSKILTDMYGFNSGSTKWLPKGSEILQLIGQYAVFVDYKKKESNGFDTTCERVKIKNIYNYDPITMTYQISYYFPERAKSTAEDHEIFTEKIIPEGFSFDIMGQGIQQTMNRFMPLSLHCKMMEESFLFDRMKNLYSERDTLPFTALADISETKKQGEMLGYSRNIQAVIKKDNGEFLTSRISSLKLHHVKGDEWRVIFKLGEGDTINYNIVFDKSDKSYKLTVYGDYIGELKFIDVIGT